MRNEITIRATDIREGDVLVVYTADTRETFTVDIITDDLRVFADACTATLDLTPDTEILREVH